MVIDKPDIQRRSPHIRGDSKHTAGILEHSMGARNRVGKGLSYRTIGWRIDSLESIHGLLKSLKYRLRTLHWAEHSVWPSHSYLAKKVESSGRKWRANWKVLCSQSLANVKIYICCYTFVVGKNHIISPLYKRYSLVKVYQKNIIWYSLFIQAIRTLPCNLILLFVAQIRWQSWAPLSCGWP
jgi:hypothetical protein